MWRLKWNVVTLFMMTFTGCDASSGVHSEVSSARVLNSPSMHAVASAPTVDAKPSSPPYDGEVSLLGTFTDRRGFVRKYVRVTSGISDKQVIDLARKLHKIEPKTWFWMLDDDSQSRQLMATLPRVEQGDDTGYPLEWVKRHSVAHVYPLSTPSGRRWVVAKGWGSDALATLE
jgi:hypothetical protein